MIAPGGQPKFVLSAATRKAVGRGDGQLEELADMEVLFLGDRLGEDHPAAGVEARGRKRRAPFHELPGRQRTRDGARWGDHPGSAIADIQEASPCRNAPR